MVNKLGLILHETGLAKGGKHDCRVYKGSHPTTPKQVETVADLGYKGSDKDLPTVRFVLPIKKKRKRKLTETKKSDTIESWPERELW